MVRRRPCPCRAYVVLAVGSRAGSGCHAVPAPAPRGGRTGLVWRGCIRTDWQPFLWAHAPALQNVSSLPRLLLYTYYTSTVAGVSVIEYERSARIVSASPVFLLRRSVRAARTAHQGGAFGPDVTGRLAWSACSGVCPPIPGGDGEVGLPAWAPLCHAPPCRLVAEPGKCDSESGAMWSDVRVARTPDPRVFPAGRGNVARPRRS